MLLATTTALLFFLESAVAHGGLHSFPTRRSSDLKRRASRCSSRYPRGGSPCCVLCSASGRPASASDRKSTRLNSSHTVSSYPVLRWKTTLYSAASQTCDAR